VIKMICPFVGACGKSVSLDYYRNVCTNIAKDAYKECPEYQKWVKEQKIPSEWGKLLTGM
jgi:hypothetical protein